MIEHMLGYWQVSWLGGTRTANMLEQGSLSKALTALRVFRVPEAPVQIAAPAPQNPALAAIGNGNTPLLVQLAEPTDTTDKLPYRDVLDQSLGHGNFAILPPERLAELKEHYRQSTGGPMPGNATPTDEQLSALHSWMNVGSDQPSNRVLVL